MASYRSQNITGALNFAKELLVRPDKVLLQTHEPLGVCLKETGEGQTENNRRRKDHAECQKFSLMETIVFSAFKTLHMKLFFFFSHIAYYCFKIIYFFQCFWLFSMWCSCSYIIIIKPVFNADHPFFLPSWPQYWSQCPFAHSENTMAVFFSSSSTFFFFYSQGWLSNNYVKPKAKDQHHCSLSILKSSIGKMEVLQ